MLLHRLLVCVIGTNATAARFAHCARARHRRPSTRSAFRRQPMKATWPFRRARSVRGIHDRNVVDIGNMHLQKCVSSWYLLFLLKTFCVRNRFESVLRKLVKIWYHPVPTPYLRVRVRVGIRTGWPRTYPVPTPVPTPYFPPYNSRKKQNIVYDGEQKIFLRVHWISPW